MERFVKINSNLYRGSAPSLEEVKQLKDIFGVNRIVSLDLESGEKIFDICKKLNIEQILLPIESGPELIESLDLLKDNILKLFDNDHVTFVHCYHGKDRTGLAVALYRIAMGWSPKEAWQEAYDLGFCKGLSKTVTKFYNSYIFNKDVNELMPQIGMQEHHGGGGLMDGVGPSLSIRRY